MGGSPDARNHATAYGGTAGCAKYAKIVNIVAETSRVSDRARAIRWALVRLRVSLASYFARR